MVIETLAVEARNPEPPGPFRVNFLKVAVPFLPLLLLSFCRRHLAFGRCHLNGRSPIRPIRLRRKVFDSRLIGLAMILGVLAR